MKSIIDHIFFTAFYLALIGIPLYFAYQHCEKARIATEELKQINDFYRN